MNILKNICLRVEYILWNEISVLKVMRSVANLCLRFTQANQEKKGIEIFFAMIQSNVIMKKLNIFILLDLTFSYY